MRFLAFLPVLLITVNSVHAMSSSRTTTTTYSNDNDDEDYGSSTTTITEENEWFGPGYYYGIWFWTWGAYYPWRTAHWYYPNGRRYYNANHPIHYNHKGNHGGGHHGGGGHGGGQHHGGGGHGGGGHH